MVELTEHEASPNLSAAGREDPTQDLIEHIARSLVVEPDAVRVRNVSVSTQAPVYELDVAERDRGRVIGKTGHTVKAIRSILGSIASRNGQQITLNVIDGRDRPVA